MQRARGFTLLEVTAGLGLAMVLAGVGAVQLVALVQTARLAGAAREVATALRLARGIALSSDASIEVRFDPGRALCETRERAGTLLSTRWPRWRGSPRRACASHATRAPRSPWRPSGSRRCASDRAPTARTARWRPTVRAFNGAGPAAAGAARRSA